MHPFPLNNIRYFYNPHAADGWPDLYDVSIRRQILLWIEQNRTDICYIITNQSAKIISLEEAVDFNFTPSGQELLDLLSNSISINFNDQRDHAAFSLEWARDTWIRRKVFNTKYTSELFSIANCLWRVKAELISMWPDFMNSMTRNIQGRFDYCTFEEDRRCVIGFEFEHEEDAAVFDLLRQSR